MTDSNQSAEAKANKQAELRKAALEYHEFPTPGKIAIAATKQLTNQRDLALAYSPGVAAPCEEIVADPSAASLLGGSSSPGHSGQCRRLRVRCLSTMMQEPV